MTSPSVPPAPPTDDEPKYGGYSRFELELEVCSPSPGPVASMVGNKRALSADIAHCSSFNLSETRTT